MYRLVTFLALLLVPMSGAPRAGMLGLTPLANVGPAVATYTDSTVVDGAAYAYWITAQANPCPAAPTCGESNPSSVSAVAIPPTGTHSVTLAWTPSTSAGVLSQNIYRVPVPLAPTFGTLTLN
jgi:hypothetical protein